MHGENNMKKLLTIAACLLIGLSTFARADMNDVSLAIVANAEVASAKTVTLRGELYSVYVDCPAGRTGTVAVASSEGTLFSKSGIVTDTWFRPRVADQTTAGVDITEVGYSATNTIYGKAAMAGPITVTVTQGTGETNLLSTWNVKLIYKR